MPNYQLILGDCLEVMKGMESDSIDTIITDPPYGLSFMGKEWDHGVPGVPFWEAALRVAKPGAMLLAFGGTRTHHRLMVAVEDAGWEIRDCLMWLYGSGFPKSHDISKAIDRRAGAEREVVGENPNHRPVSGVNYSGIYAGGNTGAVAITAPATSAAALWHGWGTALKPAWEPIIVAMKPLDGTFAQNALRHGVGGLNVDGGRLAHNEECKPMAAQTNRESMTGNGKVGQGERHKPTTELKPNGRWPANVILDEEAARQLDQTGGERCRASRFFYVAKASRSEREAGLEGLPERDVSYMNTHGGDVEKGETWHPVDDRTGEVRDRFSTKARNHHPTVKPVKLMEYLCQLTATPTGGMVLDPFCGTASTGVACVRTGRAFVGIEISPEYHAIAQRRLEEAQMQPRLELDAPAETAGGNENEVGQAALFDV